MIVWHSFTSGTIMKLSGMRDRAKKSVTVPEISGDSVALFHFRDNYETIRDAGRSKEIRDCPGDFG